MSMKRWFIRLWLLGCLLLAPRLDAATTQVRLLLSHSEARAGDTVIAGIQFKPAAGWHLYWNNPGDSGIAPVIEWALPVGVIPGEAQWPVPVKLTEEGLATFVYRDAFVLRVPLKLEGQFSPGPLTLKAKIKWQECATQCVLGKADVQATLVIGASVRASADAALLDAALAKLPATNTTFVIKAYWEKESADESRPVVFEFNTQPGLSEWDFYTHASKTYEMDGKVEKLASDSHVVRFRKLIKKSGDAWPAEVIGLLVGGSKADNPSVGYETKLAIEAAPAAAATGASRSPSVDQPKQSLIAMLGLAFLGGLILNIMPCVLPVIALKILGFVNQSKEDPGRVRKLGLIYGLGVLVSFLALAGMVIAVQQAGRLASWGMQFQNPQFLVAITILVTLVALNLFGLFEVTLSGGAMGAAGQLASKHGPSGAFFNGVLATALATPCTAPFLGVALGFAFAQSPAIIVLMFLTVGLGLAFPYVLLSWEPKWLKFLPKPGVWMEKFKIAMGFPMVATAFWLYSLASPNFGKNGGFWLAIFLVLLAMAAWIWGEFVQRGSKRKGLAWGIVVALLVFGYTCILEGQLHWRSPTPIQANGNENLQESPDGIAWKAWSPAAVESARKAGKVVFVDFTADWCVTCQANKKTSIEISSVRAKLKELGAVALLGDYTHEVPEITAELKRYGRAGVPLVLVYPKDAGKPAIVLPELLTPGIVLDALEKAGQ